MKNRYLLKKERICAFSLCIIIFNYLLYNSTIINFKGEHLFLLNYLLLLGCFISSKSKKKMVFLFIIAVIPIFITFIIFPNNITYSTESQRLQLFFSTSIPIIMLTSLIYNYEDFFYSFKVLIYLLQIILILLLILSNIVNTHLSQDILGFIASLCGAFFILYKKKFIPIVFLNLAIIIQYGQRNPMIVIMIALLIRILNLNTIKKKPMISFIIILLSSFVIINIELIFQFLQNHGISSRTTKLFFSGELASHMSGRDEIYETILFNITHHPFDIYGIFGDRIVLKNYNLPYVYAHNLILELICEFGIFFGSSMVLYLAYATIKTYLLDFSDKLNFLLKYFLSISLGMLFFNNSLWSFPFFWIFIILFLRNFATKKKVRIIQY